MTHLVISYMADHPEVLPVFASAMRVESPEYFKDWTTSDMEDMLLRPALQKERLPLALVAHLDGIAVGMASLRDDSVTTHSHLKPWLAALQVLPGHRGVGIGAKLIRAIEAEADRLGIGCIYAGSGRAAPLFQRLGWEILERVSYHGEPTAILRRDLLKPNRSHD